MEPAMAKDGADFGKRSPYYWPLVVLGLSALAWVLRMGIGHILHPIWYEWNPGRSVGYWLLETPLREIAPDVRFFFLYVPDCIVLFLAGLVIGTICLRHPFRLICILCVALLVVHHFQGGSPVAYAFQAAESGQWDLVIRHSAFTAIIYGSLFAGGWVGARYLAKKPPEHGYCERCGYDLRGLPEPRCPECGLAFDLGSVKIDM